MPGPYSAFERHPGMPLQLVRTCWLGAPGVTGPGPPQLDEIGAPSDMMFQFTPPQLSATLRADVPGPASNAAAGAAARAIEHAPASTSRRAGSRNVATCAPSLMLDAVEECIHHHRRLCERCYRSSRRKSAEAAAMPRTAATASTPISTAALDGMPTNRVRSAFTS